MRDVNRGKRIMKNRIEKLEEKKKRGEEEMGIENSEKEVRKR